MPLDVVVAARSRTAIVLVAVLCGVCVNVLPAGAQPLGYGIAGPAGAGGEFGVFGSSRVLLVLSLNGTVALKGRPTYA